MVIPRLLAPLLGVGAVVAMSCSAALAGSAQRVSILEENDSLYGNSDKHYTQGLRVAWLGPQLPPESGWNAPFTLLGGGGAVSARRYAVFLGQSLFTPKSLALKPPDRHDRPYAGWLYAGTSLLQEKHGNALEHLELQLGIVGPSAFGKTVQNQWHQFIGIAKARGWSSQIQNEPGAMLSYERLWRLPLIGDAVDAVPSAGLTAGNVFTYAAAGALLRVGNALRADYGPTRIRPALSGTDFVDEAGVPAGPGFYAYVGAQGRAVAHNIFLDGNTFRSGPHVARQPLVADFEGGLVLYWSSAFRAEFSIVRRTREFVGQVRPDEIGTVSAAFAW